VVGDRRIAVDGNADLAVDYFEAEILSARDFYPFGMVMPERSFSTQAYRYGFQSQESDPEWLGEGNAVAFKYRVHDVRLGRFFSVDPLAPNFPWNSEYAFSENRIISAIELEGLEALDYSALYVPSSEIKIKVPKWIHKVGLWYDRNSRSINGTLNLVSGYVALNIGIAFTAAPGFQGLGAAMIIGGVGQMGLGAAQLIDSFQPEEKQSDKLASFQGYGDLIGYEMEEAGIPNARVIGHYSFEAMNLAGGLVRSPQVIAKNLPQVESNFKNAKTLGDALTVFKSKSTLKTLVAYSRLAGKPAEISAWFQGVSWDLFVAHTPEEQWKNVDSYQSSLKFIESASGRIGYEIEFQTFDSEGRLINAIKSTNEIESDTHEH
jgi:hypothetical protein